MDSLEVTRQESAGSRYQAIPLGKLSRVSPGTASYKSGIVFLPVSFFVRVSSVSSDRPERRSLRGRQRRWPYRSVEKPRKHRT